MPYAYLLANLRAETGKTTLAAHLAASWAKANQKGALLDFDPEGHLAHHLGIPVLAGHMANHVTEDEVYGESAFRLEGDAPWRARLDLFPLEVEDAYRLSPETLRGYSFVLMDTPPHDLPCLLRALSVLWELKRAGWEVQVVVPHPVSSAEHKGSRETLNFLNTLYDQTGAYFSVALVPLLPEDRQEPATLVGIPNYAGNPIRTTPAFRVDAHFKEAARFGLTVFELTSNLHCVYEMEAIAHFLMPIA